MSQEVDLKEMIKDAIEAAEAGKGVMVTIVDSSKNPVMLAHHSANWGALADFAQCRSALGRLAGVPEIASRMSAMLTTWDSMFGTVKSPDGDKPRGEWLQ